MKSNYDPKVSIIVPVYNAEKFLKNCIDSLLQQTFQGFEVIFVNDGSKDKSDEILKSFVNARKDLKNQFVYIYKNNGGVSSARNEGLKIARGEYVTFLDPDDSLKTNALHAMIDSAEKDKSDFVFAPVFSRIYSNGDEKVINEDTEKEKYDIKNETDLKKLWEQIFIKYIGTTVWGKLYDNKIIRANKLSFYDVNQVYAEDALFNAMYSKFVKKMSVVTEPSYNYFQNVDSITQKRKDPLKIISSMNNLYTILNENEPNFNNVKSVFAGFYFTNCMIQLENATQKEVSYAVNNLLNHELINCVPLEKLEMEKVMPYKTNNDGLIHVVEEMSKLPLYKLSRKVPQLLQQHIKNANRHYEELHLSKTDGAPKINLETILKVSNKQDISIQFNHFISENRELENVTKVGDRLTQLADYINTPNFTILGVRSRIRNILNSSEKEEKTILNSIGSKYNEDRIKGVSYEI